MEKIESRLIRIEEKMNNVETILKEMKKDGKRFDQQKDVCNKRFGSLEISSSVLNAKILFFSGIMASVTSGILITLFKFMAT